MQKVARAWLITISLLNGLAGLVCGPLLIARPDGRLLMATALLPVVHKLPLANVSISKTPTGPFQTTVLAP